MKANIRVFPEVKHPGPHKAAREGGVCVACAAAAKDAKLRVEPERGVEESKDD